MIVIRQRLEFTAVTGIVKCPTAVFKDNGHPQCLINHLTAVSEDIFGMGETGRLIHLMVIDNRSWTSTTNGCCRLY